MMNVGDWMRRKDAAQYARVDERTILDWHFLGLRHSKIGGITLYRREWIDDFLQAHAIEFESPQEIAEGMVADVFKKTEETGRGQ